MLLNIKTADNLDHAVQQITSSLQILVKSALAQPALNYLNSVDYLEQHILLLSHSIRRGTLQQVSAAVVQELCTVLVNAFSCLAEQGRLQSAFEELDRLVSAQQIDKKMAIPLQRLLARWRLRLVDARIQSAKPAVKLTSKRHTDVLKSLTDFHDNRQESLTNAFNAQDKLQAEQDIAELEANYTYEVVWPFIRHYLEHELRHEVSAFSDYLQQLQPLGSQLLYNGCFEQAWELYYQLKIHAKGLAGYDAALLEWLANISHCLVQSVAWPHEIDYTPAWQRYRALLESARKPLELTLQEDNLDNFVQAQQRFSEQLQTLVSLLFQDGERWLGSKPDGLSYCFIAQGSLSSGSASLYSDIEMALLIEPEPLALFEETSYSQYLTALYCLFEFQVVSIGEPYGFRLDAGGHPRVESHLIGHPERLNATLQNFISHALQNHNPDEAEVYDTLWYSLLNPIALHGDKSMLGDYLFSKGGALQSQYGELTWHVYLAKTHLQRHNAAINTSSKGVNIKRDYLSLLAHVIKDLALLFQMPTHTPLVSIDALQHGNIFSPAMAKECRQAVCGLQRLRNRLYQQARQQQDEGSLETLTEKEKELLDFSRSLFAKLSRYYVQPLLRVSDNTLNLMAKQPYPYDHEVARWLTQGGKLTDEILDSYAYHQIHRPQVSATQLALFNALKIEQRYAYYLRVKDVPNMAWPLGSLHTAKGERCWPWWQLERLKSDLQQLGVVSKDRMPGFALQLSGDKPMELHADVKNLVWDNEQQTLLPSMVKHSRHPVYALSQEALPRMHLKFFPAWSGMEMMVQGLAKRLTVNGVSSSQVVKLILNKRSYPVLVSHTVSALDLQDALNTIVGFETQLDPQSLSRLLLLSLLINPEDGKPDNYMVVRHSAGYQIVSIDNDQAMVEPLEYEKNRWGFVTGNTRVKAKCILFCLGAMQRPLAPEVVEEFCQLNNYELLADWLMELDRYDSACRILFGETMVAQSVKSRCVIPPLLRPGLISELYQKLRRLQRMLQLQPLTSPLALLETVEPLLAKAYRPLLDQALSPLERFDALTQHDYETLVGDKRKSLANSLQTVQSVLQKLPDEGMVLSDEYRPARALEELKQLVQQHQHYDSIVDKMQQGSIKDFLALTLDEDKEAVLNQLSSPYLGMLALQAQQRLIQSLQGGNYQKLNLRNCRSLTDSQLIALLATSQSLQSLDIQGCTKLTLASLTALASLPHLKHLALTGLTLPALVSIGFPNLVHLIVEHCPHLEVIQLQSPRLTRLEASNNPKLQFIRTQSTELYHLNVTSCAQLSAWGLEQAAKVPDSLKQFHYQDTQIGNYTTNYNPQIYIDAYPGLILCSALIRNTVMDSLYDAGFGYYSYVRLDAIILLPESILLPLLTVVADLPKHAWENLFLEAARQGHLNLIKHMYAQDAKLEYVDEKGSTALLEAARSGKFEVVKYLLELGANLNHDERRTAIIEAADNGYPEIVKYLHKQGVCLNHDEVNAVLIEAAANGQLEVVKYLHEQDADLNHKDNVGNTALINAAANGQLEVVKFLCELGAHLNYHERSAALYYAANAGYIEVVKYLCEQGADLNYNYWQGNTALINAAASGQLAIVKCLCELGADLNHQNNKGNTALIKAAEYGQLEVVKYLCDQGVDLNYKDWQDNTALIKAAECGQLEVVKYLCDQGVDLNYKDWQDNTALIKAAECGQLKIVKYLCDQGVDLNHQNNKGNTALIKAAECGQLKIVKFLCELGAHLNYHEGSAALYYAANAGYIEVVKYLQGQGADLNYKNWQGNTALINAAASGQLAIVKCLCELGADLNHKDNEGYTALTKAMERGQLEVVKCLCELGADLNHQNNKGYNALTKAIERGQLEVVKCLCELGADLNHKDNYGHTALTKAIERGQLEVVKYLHERGADLNHQNNKGYTALLWAASYGKLEFVKYLQEQGADLNHQDNKGYTALLWAARYGQLEVVKYLQELGADLNHQDNKGYTALLWAARYGQLEVVKYLQELGADLNYQDNKGNTALTLAARYGQLEVVKYLQEQGADLNHQDKEGNTALLWAARYGQLEVVKYLQEQGADLNHQNNEGYTALIWAAATGQLEVIKCLCKLGADLNHKDCRGNTALIKAASRRYLKVFIYLLDRDTSLNYKADNIALLWAARYGQLEVVKYLLELGADLNHQDNEGYTALFLAARYGKLEFVKYLQELGADLNHQNNKGYTALIWAAATGQLEVVKFLCELGADLNHKDNVGNTALVKAIELDQLEVVKYLQEQDAELNHQDKEGYTALLWAAATGQLEVVKCLCELGADLNHQDNEGNTALLLAARYGKLEFVKYLQELGADLNHQNNKGYTALIWATANGQLEVVKCLCELGADLNHQNNEGNTALNIALRENYAEVAKYLQQHIKAQPEDTSFYATNLQVTQSGYSLFQPATPPVERQGTSQINPNLLPKPD